LGTVIFELFFQSCQGDLPAAGFVFGIAFHALHLVFDFLLGHLQAPLDAVPLPEVIHQCQDEQQQADADGDAEEDVSGESEDLEEAQLLSQDDLPDATVNGGVGHQSHQRKFEHAHTQLDQTLATTEKPGETPDGIERGKAKLQPAEVEIESGLSHVHQHGDQHHSDQQRHKSDANAVDRATAGGAQVGGGEPCQRIPTEHVAEGIAQHFEHTPAVPAKHEHAAHQQHRCGEIGAACDVALLAGFLAPLGRWCFCFVAIAFVSHRLPTGLKQQ